MRVIKLGGRAQGDTRLPALMRSSWEKNNGNLCVVHGGGDEITLLQSALGKKPRFIAGRRATTADDIKLLRMVLSGAINKRLVNAFARGGVPCVGLSGEDGELIGARRRELDALGEVGSPEKINASLIDALVSAGYMPVISPVGYDLSDGETGALNVNGDDAAAAIAAALRAEELLFVADVEGVMAAGGAVIRSVESAGIDQLVKDGIARGGMAAKLDAARSALDAGVERVRISDLEAIMDDARGTAVNRSGVAAK